MKKEVFLSLVAASLMTFTACQSPSFEYSQADSGNVTINVTAKASEEFFSVTAKSADAGTKFGTYFFKPDGSCFKGRQNDVSSEMEYSYSFEAENGQYTVAALVGYTNGEGIATAGLTTSSVVNFPKTLHNLYLGSTTVDVVDGKDEYDATITATRLMAVLNVAIDAVPSNVNAISITLPSQASQFTFLGAVSGTGTSQTFNLSKGAESTTASGTYIWSVSDQVIYPSADGCTTMPINVTVTFADNTSKSYSATYKETTQGVTCCTRGTKTTLTSKMSSSTTISASIILDESFTSENTGTFDMTENK